MLDAYNLYPLHIFRLIARGGSVTRASQELSISQPAVSAHLKALETVIGEPLFERTPQGMQLTEAGAVKLKQVNRLFAQKMYVCDVITFFEKSYAKSYG